MEGTEELVLLVGMGAKQASLALVQLDLSCLNGSGHAPLLCDHGSNFSVCVVISLELSCDSPVFLGPGVVVHCSVHGFVGEALEEPVRELPLFFNGDALRGEELMLVDGFIDADGAQAVEPVQFDVQGEDMHGVVSIRDRDEEIKDISFVFLVTFWPLTFSLPVGIPLVRIFLPVFISRFQVSHMCFTLCQILSSLLEYFELFLIVTAGFLIFSCNSCQSLHDEEELLSSR